MSPKNRVLLVEGRDDEQIIYQFCNYYGIDNRQRLTVKALDGITELLRDLQLRIRSSEIETLGVVLDADTDLQAQWERIRAIVEPQQYTLPDRPNPTGTIVTSVRPQRPRLGIWIMPDNQLTGTIEDFLLYLTRRGDTLLNRARAAIEAIPHSERRFKPSYYSKALIHTWLAWQEEPGTALGLAITRNYLDPGQNPAPAFKIWLETLFWSI